MTALRPAKTRLHEAPAVAAAALLAGVPLLFQPAEIYAANAVALFFGLAQLWLVLVPAFLLVFLVLLGLARTGPARWCRASEAVLAGLAIAAWAGASFFTASRGSLNGGALLRLATPLQVWTNAACYAVLIAGGAAAMWRWPVPMRRLLAALCAVLAAYAAWVAVSEAKPWRDAPANERLATFSTERNVLVILLDTLQSDFFAEVLQSDPGVARALDGFTYFPNAVGSAPTTYLSMPAIHSGTRLTSGEGMHAVYQDNVVEQSFVAKLAAAGYDAMVVDAIINACPRGAFCDHQDQMVHGRAGALAGYAAFLANVALFRAVPHVLKPMVYREGEWMGPWHLFTEQGATSNALLERMARDAKAGAARPTVRFVHLFNTHPPARQDGECRGVAGAAWTRATAVAQVHCALTRVNLLLAAMQRNGTYDASAIVLLADHGAGLSAFALGAAASPALAVKPFRARGPLKVSRDVVGLADIPATICGITGACTAARGANLLAGGVAKPEYGFLNYEWLKSGLWGADDVPILDRYLIVGPPHDQASWQRLPPALRSGPLLHLAFASTDPAAAYGAGWSGFEAAGERHWRWATGRRSELRLRVEEPRDMVLRLQVSTHAGNAGQTITARVNGVNVGERPVGTAAARIDFPVPRGALARGENDIAFDYRSANPPGAGDPRELAVGFQDLSLLPAK